MTTKDSSGRRVLLRRRESGRHPLTCERGLLVPAEQGLVDRCELGAGDGRVVVMVMTTSRGQGRSPTRVQAPAAKQVADYACELAVAAEFELSTLCAFSSALGQ